MKRKYRLLLDLDDTITIFMSTVVAKYNEVHGTNHQMSEITQWDISGVFEHNIWDILATTDILQHMPMKTDADKYIKKWIEEDNIDVFIVTATLHPLSYRDKLEWVKTYLPFFPLQRVIPLKEKGAVWGDMLVDDNEDNLRNWLRDNPIVADVLMMDCHHNQNQHSYSRVFNFEQVDEIIIGALNHRKDIEVGYVLNESKRYWTYNKEKERWKNTCNRCCVSCGQSKTECYHHCCRLESHDCPECAYK